MQKEVFSRVLWACPGVLLMLAYSQENLICPFKFMLEFSLFVYFYVFSIESLGIDLYWYLPFELMVYIILNSSLC